MWLKKLFMLSFISVIVCCLSSSVFAFGKWNFWRWNNPKLTPITAAADRVVELQRTDVDWEGTWYWHSESTSNATNLTGVTALGLIEAYKETRDSLDLEAAIDAANFIMTHLGAGATGTQHHVRTTAPDIVFLHKLSRITHDSQYAERAVLEWENIKAFYPTAADLDELFRSINRPSKWDFAFFVEAACLSGDMTWADDAAVILADLDDPFYNDTETFWYPLNLAGSIRALINCRYYFQYSLSVKSLLNDLKDLVGEDGLGGDVQNNAYALIAFEAAGRKFSKEAHFLAKWLVDNQEENGGWIVEDLEYPEIDGEALQAIALSTGFSKLYPLGRKWKEYFSKFPRGKRFHRKPFCPGFNN